MAIEPSSGLIPFAELQEHDAVMELLSKALPKGGRVLDCPCGVGYFSTLDVERKFEFEAVDCVPPSYYLVDGVEYHQADLNQGLDFLKEESFDAVVSIEGIEHLESPANFIRSCYRLLKPGGIFLVATPNIMTIASRFKFLFTGLFHQVAPLNEWVPQGANGEEAGDGGEADRGHLHVPTYLELRYLLHETGFRLKNAGAQGRKNTDFFYLFFYPLLYLSSFLVLRRERDERQKRVNLKEILPDIMSMDLLLNRNLILMAEKKALSRKDKS